MLAKILPRLERHHTAVGRAEDGSKVELAKVTDEDVGTNRQSLDKKDPRSEPVKLTVMALEMPARDQPVAVDMGSRNTASENIAPMATQVINAPTATITQRYKPVMRAFPKTVCRPS
jgi:hypothetical protein